MTTTAAPQFPTLPMQAVLIERALTVEEAMEIMGLCRTEFLREVALGRLRVRRISQRKMVVPPSAVRAWLNPEGIR